MSHFWKLLICYIGSINYIVAIGYIEQNGVHFPQIAPTAVWFGFVTKTVDNIQMFRVLLHSTTSRFCFSHLDTRKLREDG